ncbi:hypothetical protein EKK70_08360 [Desulfovibrio sp. DS-1]|uniref:Uncharacterized protein n=1 Tax=Nitratidesulfovibrio vulgaris (strain DSM 19637 / Miyazaki F) TaxID=883 RepID=B8DLE3_NITV9|nr:hypothetical protein EKK70_08360 [Desulfovibrio sp. DS-1]
MSFFKSISKSRRQDSIVVLLGFAVIALCKVIA